MFVKFKGKENKGTSQPGTDGTLVSIHCFLSLVSKGRKGEPQGQEDQKAKVNRGGNLQPSLAHMAKNQRNVSNGQGG
jgi:hypothetical protein